MGGVWRAEVVVDESLARRLVRGRFGGVAADDVELVSAGWDYTVHRVDREWAFRFPRRAVVVEALARELAVLPVLAPVLPVPVPEPVHVGEPDDGFPWPFYGARWLAGVEATGVRDRAALAAPLGAFLRRLHGTDLPDLPVDVNGRADMERRVPLTRKALAEVAGLWTAPPGVEEVLREAEALAPAVPAAVCHGDLHVRQILVEGGRLTGIVDWVDVCVSDPGIDLAIAFAFLPPDARPAFFAAYGPAEASSLVRARVLALNLSAILAAYGRAEGIDQLEQEAVASLDRCVADL